MVLKEILKILQDDSGNFNDFCSKLLIGCISKLQEHSFSSNKNILYHILFTCLLFFYENLNKINN